MPVPTTKDELIKDIETTYKKLRPEFDIDEKLALEETMEGQIKGTTMSVHNLVSYLNGWGQRMLEWDDFYRKNHQIPEIGTNYGEIAKSFYEKYQGVDYQKLLGQFDKTVEDILKMLEGKTNDELYGNVWYTASSGSEYSFGRLVQFNTSSPYKNARNRIRKWKKEKNL
ncbi:hypothetical protein CR969_01390 [Candidatus Saccharibacteria bacterium]|nr:MAG: hypothetical protein CR969_01390 [Candidatus Saccharibacteria bacterium]